MGCACSRATYLDRAMPTFFFDIHDGKWIYDDVGVECENIAEACRHAKRALPAIALDNISQDDDRHAITVIVTDNDRRPVYTASLIIIGMMIS